MPQDSSTDQQSLNDIISDILSSQVIANSTTVSNSSSVVQSAVNSTNCKNIATVSSSQVVVADTTVFMSNEIYQKTVSDLTNSLSATVEQELDKLLDTGEQSIDMTQIIQNLIVNKLTQETLDINNNAGSDQLFLKQECNSTTGSVNYYSGTTDDVYRFYTRAYSSDSAVQDVSATIANIADAAAAQKQIGLVESIARLIFILVVLVIIVAAVVVMVIGIFYLPTLAKV